MTSQPPKTSVWRRTIDRGLLVIGVLVGLATVVWAAREHPVLSVLVLAGWSILLYGARIVSRMVHRRAARLAGADHAEMVSTLSGLGRSYLRILAARVDRVALAGTIDGDRPAVRLTDVYVDIEVRRAGETEQDTRPFVGTARKGDGRQPFLALLRKRRAGLTVVAGEPGSGKTTALRRAVIELSRHRFGRRRIPILLDLAEHGTRLGAPNPPPLPAVAAGLGWLNRQIPVNWFARQLAAGRCVVMFDGLDEVVGETQRQRMADWIRTQAAAYPRSAMVVTSRPEGLKADPLSQATVWRLHHLDSGQVAGFAYAWCEAIERRKAGHTSDWLRDETAAEAGVLLSRLRAKPALYDLAGNPMLLTLTALIHRHCGVLPVTMAGLHADAARLLIHRQSADPVAGRITTGLTGLLRERTVRRLAEYMMDNQLARVTEQDMAEVLPADAVPLFVSQCVNGGLLSRVGEDRYGFAHSSIQYYLAALALRDDETAVITRIGDPWWRDTILLWGAGADVTKVVETCLRSGDVAALALAFDLAEVAAELSADVRLRLKELLALATETLAEARLLGAVKVATELGDMARMYGGGRLARRPVSRSLYQSFLDSEYPSGHRAPLTPETEAEPAVGMWPADALRFVAWINALPRNDDTRYRLPTEAELCQPLPDLPSDHATHSLWIPGGRYPRLHHTGKARDPYTVGRGWWHAAAGRDRYRSTLLLWQLSMVLGTRARSLNKDLAGEIDLNRSRAFALPKDLQADAALIRARRFLAQTDLSPAGDGPAEPRAREHLDQVIDCLGELAGKSLDFQGDAANTETEQLPFGFLDRLSVDERRILATGYTVLWFTSRPSRARLEYGQALASFDGYLADGILPSGINSPQTVVPQLLMTALEEAHQLLKAQRRPGVWFDLACELMTEVVERLSATLAHSASYTEDNVACARPALVAVASVISDHALEHQGSAATLRPIVSQLSTAIAGLTVLENRRTGAITPNEAIVLVRQ